MTAIADKLKWEPGTPVEYKGSTVELELVEWHTIDAEGFAVQHVAICKNGSLRIEADADELELASRWEVVEQWWEVRSSTGGMMRFDERREAVKALRRWRKKPVCELRYSLWKVTRKRKVKP